MNNAFRISKAPHLWGFTYSKGKIVLGLTLRCRITTLPY